MTTGKVINFLSGFCVFYGPNILKTMFLYIWGHLFSTYAKFPEKLTFLTPLRRTPTPYKAFSKNKKRSTTSLPAPFFA